MYSVAGAARQGWESIDRLVTSPRDMEKESRQANTVTHMGPRSTDAYLILGGLVELLSSRS